MVRNSPWAMLMTPICPKMMASPRAMSSRTANELSPLKPCMTTIEKRLETEVMASSGSLVALGERVRLDQGRLVEDLELTVGLGLPDAQLAPQVVVLVDLHVALGRGLQLDPRGGRHDLVDVEALGLLDGVLPQPGAFVGGLGDV